MLKVSSTLARCFLILIVPSALCALDEYGNKLISRNYNEYVPSNEEELLQFLNEKSVSEKETIEKVFSDGATPLMIAAKVGSVALTKLLLENGANPMTIYVERQVRTRHFKGKKVSSDSHSQIISQCREKRVPKIRKNRRKSLPDSHLSSVVQTKENAGILPIHFAAFSNHAEVIEVLLQGGPTSQIYFPDGEGNNPLHIAILEKKLEALLALMNGPRGGSILYADALKMALNARNNHRMNPMHALIIGLPEAPEEEQNIFDCIERNKEIAAALVKLELMVNKGGDINLLYTHKRSLYDLAKEKKAETISAFLGAKGIRVKKPSPEIIKIQAYVRAREVNFVDYLKYHASDNISEEELVNNYFKTAEPPPKKNILEYFRIKK